MILVQWVKSMVIIGIDCATKQEKIGLAYGSVDNRKLIVTDVAVGSRDIPAVEIIQRWLQRGQPALLAFDAPLGWPTALGQGLRNHSAGMPVRAEADCLFSRETDRNVKDRIGKRPLEVGANLIARTAHAALGLLQDLRDKTGLAIPLAWDMGEIRETCAIEVYPAATLVVLRIKAGDYRKKDASIRRFELIDELEKHLGVVIPQRKMLEENSDAVDAVICVLAGYDFILGNCLPPDNNGVVRKEGWIWLRRQDLNGRGI